MKATTNYGLKKPELNDMYNVDDFNYNVDIIDTELKATSTKTDNALAHLSDTSNPHNVTKEQVGLGNVPNVSTNDQTPTYTVSSSNANLSSGEKLSAAMGKIAKAVSSLISHMANVSNPHSVTKSHVGLGKVPNVATNDQTPTYTVASSNENLTSGEVLSVAFGKIAKAINSLISHLADTVGHITSAERTKWNGKLDATATAVNADAVDNYHASDFVLLQNLIGGNIGSKCVYYTATMNKDCNDIDVLLAVAIGADGLHYPLANVFYYILTLKYDDNAKKQIAFDYGGNKTYVRYCKSGTWYDWVNIASGGNADTVDGKHASDFVEISGANMSGNIDMKGNKIKSCAGSYSAELKEQYANACIELREKDFIGSANKEIGYAPTLGFHWAGVVGAAILMDSTGAFHFVRSDGTYCPLKTSSANVIVSTTAPTDTTAVWIVP